MHPNSLRRYGVPPVIAAVIHGGPGACGELAPVARELASFGGVLEPLLTAASIEGQLGAVRTSLEENGNPSITLIGFSFGAWLSLLFAARHPTLVKKLIIVGCGGLEDNSGQQTLETRLKRLDRVEAADLMSIIDRLGDPETDIDNAAYTRLKRLLLKADAYDPAILKADEIGSIEFHADVFRSVWKEASQLRESGRLLELAGLIRCPVTAIHGDYDPHPAHGVREPLSAVLKAFRFVLLEDCGHTPWIEKRTREAFYRIVKEEIS
jgi:pimeloyl-ACP methyl ester carboxylesterase